MKQFVIGFALVSGMALSAHASAIECKGRDVDSKVAMSVLDISQVSVDEGKSYPVAVRVTETVTNARGYQEEAVLFAGVVNGKSEDVMFMLSSKDRKSLKGTIFMDEMNDVTMTLGSREINLDCQSE